MNKDTLSENPQKRSFCLLDYYSLILFALLASGLSFALQSDAWNIPRARAHPVAKESTRAIKQQRDGSAFTVTSLDTLSTSLAAYLTSLGSNAAMVVEDMTHRHTYSSNSTQQFLAASSIKVPIMLAFFAQTESQGREPNSTEMNLLTTMIENSDNDAASALYSDINGASGLNSFFQQIGVKGLTPDDDAWGYSQITPQTMVDLLAHLQTGTILTAPDRATALQLMQQVETDQRWGAGDTAPGGSTVAMKNGWVPGPDNLWSVNSSGIITTGGETYIISVYTQEQPSLANGQAIVQQVCADVTATLK